MSAAARKRKAPARKTARKGKRDLVYGLGATGLSVARYLHRCDAPAVFADTRDKPPGLDELHALDADAEIWHGEIGPKQLQDIARIVVSPGIADDDALLVAARKSGIQVVSDIELFVRDARAPLVAITGSNGKSTVTTLLALMCRAADVAVLAGANLGEPALDLLEAEAPDLYLLELSSFQLQRTRNLAAKVAVLLNICPDHLDWHRSVEEYRAAKQRVFGGAQAAVFNRADDDVSSHIPADISCISFGLDVPAADHYGIISDDGQTFLARGEQLLLATADIAMLGRHNEANALAALAVGELLDLPLSAMLQVLHEFPGLPHRMQRVAVINDVEYVNDSKATNVGAAIASVESVAGPVVLLAGGQGKCGDFDALAKAVGPSLREAVLYGEDATRLEDAFSDLAPTYRARDLEAALARATAAAMPGDTVLLAPACASFDQYENFERRGEEFTRLVRSLPA